MTSVVGYRRDASWHRNPGTRYVTRVHVIGSDGSQAACSSRIMLDTDKPVNLLGLPHADTLCRRCFPLAGTGATMARTVWRSLLFSADLPDLPDLEDSR